MRYAAFLRGINLGRERRVGGADLRAAFEALGFEDVATFRASGNVVFTAGGTPTTDRVEDGLAASLGLPVATFLRGEAEVRALAEQHPFPPEDVETSAGKLQVLLLPRTPGASARADVLALATDSDRLALGKRELWWLPSGGIRDSTLDLKSIEQLVGPTTMRTKGTIEQLAAKYFSAE